jgi:outer membrane protein assembly factor BamB
MMSGWGYTESPLVDGNKVLGTPGGSKGTLAAFDKKTGDVLWRSTGITESAGYSSIITAEVGGLKQYIQFTGESVFGVAPDTGKTIWRFVRKGRTAVIPTPICADNFVFITSGYGVGCNLVQLTRTGDGVLKPEEVYNNKNMTNHHGGVVLLDGKLYGYSDGKNWICQDFKTGEVVWSSRALGKGSVTCAGACLYCYDERDGTVVLAEVNPKAWVEKGRFSLPETSKLRAKSGKFWTHPVVANGRLYLRDQDLIFCYDVKAAN